MPDPGISLPVGGVAHGEVAAQKPRRCDTCRWWSMHSLDMRKGDCKVPGDHRYSHVRLETRDYKTGKTSSTVAYLDSFGPESTKPNFVCGAWDDGEPGQAIADTTEPQVSPGTDPR